MFQMVLEVLVVLFLLEVLFHHVTLMALLDHLVLMVLWVPEGHALLVTQMFQVFLTLHVVLSLHEVLVVQFLPEGHQDQQVLPRPVVQMALLIQLVLEVLWVLMVLVLLYCLVFHPHHVRLLGQLDQWFLKGQMGLQDPFHPLVQEVL